MKTGQAGRRRLAGDGWGCACLVVAWRCGGCRWRKKLHLKHHQESGQVTDAEERLIGLGLVRAARGVVVGMRWKRQGCCLAITCHVTDCH